MKKLLMIMLLTFTTMASADDGDYLMTAEGGESDWMWILDTEQGKVKACWTKYYSSTVIECTKWKDLHDD